MEKTIVIIGGGASGMMAAGIAGSRGLKVILLEKNDTLGKKIFISGKGRCNITNSSPINEFIDNIPGNGHFLYSALYTFSNEDLISFFERLGLKTKIERGNRVFPISDKSNDVIIALTKFLKENKVDIRLNSSVKNITKQNDKFLVTTNDGTLIEAANVIISTGGKSYPKTGSTGDGYDFASNFGHQIIHPKPSLVPLISTDEWVPKLQGLSLKNVSIKLLKNNKKLYSDFGEMLFTHFGVSGPIVLSASRHLVDVDFSKADIKLIIDLKPALGDEQLDKRIQRDLEKYINKQFKNSLDDLLPQKMIPVMIEICGIDSNKQSNQITKPERLALINNIKNLAINISGTRPITEGIITCGGVSTNEINPSTMESKLVKGLYFTGEVIDVDGYTGGYNLQIAFSTGYLAGNNV